MPAKNGETRKPKKPIELSQKAITKLEGIQWQLTKMFEMLSATAESVSASRVAIGVFAELLKDELLAEKNTEINLHNNKDFMDKLENLITQSSLKLTQGTHDRMTTAINDLQTIVAQKRNPVDPNTKTKEELLLEVKNVAVKKLSDEAAKLQENIQAQMVAQDKSDLETMMMLETEVEALKPHRVEVMEKILSQYTHIKEGLKKYDMDINQTFPKLVTGMKELFTKQNIIELPGIKAKFDAIITPLKPPTYSYNSTAKGSHTNEPDKTKLNVDKVDANKNKRSP